MRSGVFGRRLRGRSRGILLLMVRLCWVESWLRFLRGGLCSRGRECRTNHYDFSAVRPETSDLVRLQSHATPVHHQKVKIADTFGLVLVGLVMPLECSTLR